MTPKGRLGERQGVLRTMSSSCSTLQPQLRLVESKGLAQSAVQMSLYRWLGYACWQWCSWPRWWPHTPILRGPPCWGTGTVSCRWGGCCAYSCWASPPSIEEEAQIFEQAEDAWEGICDCCGGVSSCGTFLQVMVGMSGSPEAAHGITSSRPASWRYSPPGLTLK